MKKTSLHDKFANLERKVDGLSHIESPKTHTLSTHPEASTLEVEKRKLNEEIQELMYSTKSYTETPDYVKHHISELKTDIKNLKKMRDRLQSPPSFLSSMNTKSLKKKEKNLLEEKEKLERENYELEKSIQYDNSEFYSLREKNNDLALSISILKERKLKLIEDKEKLATKFIQIKDDIENYEKLALTLRREISGLQGTCDYLTDNSKSMEQAKEKKLEEITSLKKRSTSLSKIDLKTKEVASNESTEDKKTIISTLPTIDTSKLDNILSEYKEKMAVGLSNAKQIDETEGNFKELYKDNLKAFNLIFKLKSSIEIYLDKYEFEDTARFAINYDKENNTVSFDVKDVSLERSSLEVFFKKEFSRREWKVLRAPRLSFFFNRAKHVKQISCRLSLSEKTITKTPIKSSSQAITH